MVEVQHCAFLLRFVFLTLWSTWITRLDNWMRDEMHGHPLSDFGPAVSPLTESQPLGRNALCTSRHDPLEAGCIDSYGFSYAVNAWIAIGWAPRLPTTVHECEIALHFVQGSLLGRCYRASYYRADLASDREGLIFLASCTAHDLGTLISTTLTWHDGAAQLFSTSQVVHLADAAIGVAATTVLAGAPESVGSTALLRALSQPRFAGVSTLHKIEASIHMAVDEVIRCGDAGVLLIGWFVSEEGATRRILLRTGRQSIPVDLSSAVRLRREDVSSAIMAQHGLLELQPGFLVFIPEINDVDGQAHIQVEAADLSLGYVALPKPILRGIAAMRRILDTFTLRYEDMVRAYDTVIGPSIAGLNGDRLRTRVSAVNYFFGEQPNSPVCTVIVPIYGRIDFMEYQLALFSREESNRKHEFIYVVDDPSVRVEVLTLAESCFARFGLSFRVMTLERNVGYAPANNAGLRAARGRLICFLNSDVFPGHDGWIDLLAARLAEDSSLGAVGPTLLFEDQTVQHRGLTYEPLQEFGRWLFPLHPGKGMRAPPQTGLEYHRAITGACMVMSRALAKSLCGFDERFVIGDFEDSDLCLRIGALKLRCAVDLDVHLYHLERQSQGDMASSWRFNLTLYNAWVHERRWRSTLVGEQVPAPASETADDA